LQEKVSFVDGTIEELLGENDNLNDEIEFELICCTELMEHVTDKVPLKGVLSL